MQFHYSGSSFHLPGKTKEETDRIVLHSADIGRRAEIRQCTVGLRHLSSNQFQIIVTLTDRMYCPGTKRIDQKVADG